MAGLVWVWGLGWLFIACLSFGAWGDRWLAGAVAAGRTVIATGALGRRWYGSRGGWAAALVVIVTPMYLRWSPDGYIDIPSALYFVLVAYGADVWLNTRRLRWALMAGALAGL